MGQREVLTVHGFSLLSSVKLAAVSGLMDYMGMCGPKGYGFSAF